MILAGLTGVALIGTAGIVGLLLYSDEAPDNALNADTNNAAVTQPIKPHHKPKHKPEAKPSTVVSPTVEASPSVEASPTAAPSENVNPTPTTTETLVTVPPTDVRLGVLAASPVKEGEPENVWKDRLRLYTNVLKGQTVDAAWDAPINEDSGLDVVITKMDQEQQLAFAQPEFAGNMFDSYPNSEKGDYFSTVRVTWRADLYAQKETATFEMYGVDGQSITVPAVNLQSIHTGATFWVLAARNPSDKNPARDHSDQSKYRHMNDLEILDAVEKLRWRGVDKDDPAQTPNPVFTAGDFENSLANAHSDYNGSMNDKAKYASLCKLAAAGLLVNAQQAAIHSDVKPKPCSDEIAGSESEVLLFTTAEIGINGFDDKIGPTTNGSRQHRLRFIDAVLPGRELMVVSTVEPSAVPTETAIPSAQASPEVSPSATGVAP
jgi:hypothetical protein